MLKDSELFEKAVADFLQALDKDAKITHDVDLPDKDTGKPRQRDVWIEAKICKIFPIKIYVSCKYKTRKLSQQDMDAVIGEFLSSGADKGVIFSKAGFYKPAIEKAKKNNITCCKLYENQAPNLPEVLILKQYCLKAKIHFNIEKIDTKKNIETYQELFNIEITDKSEKSQKLINKIHYEFRELEKYAIKKENRENFLPKDWVKTINIKTIDEDNITIKLGIGWNIFEAMLEAFLLNGSYLFTESTFIGTQIGPAIDVKSSHPGDCWKLLKKRPKISKNFLTTTCTGGDCINTLIRHYGKKKVK